MKTLLYLSLFLSATLIAQTSIKLEKGWQFIGFPSNIDKVTEFKTSNVDIVWGYDGKTQTWLGYSPSSQTNDKILTKGYGSLKSIAPWQGVWIHNKKEWTINLEDSTNTDTNISLKKGWNLISLPTDMTISPTIFKKDIVWKYDKNDWQLADNNTNTTSIAPPISKINSAEAIWVKSSTTHEVSLSQDASALHTFKSKKEMEAYIKEMVLESYKPRFNEYSGDTYAKAVPEIALADGVAGGATNASDSQKSSDATGTNLQEGDVDESDILKNDGTHIFFYDRGKNIVRITNFDNLSTNAQSTISPITLDKDTFLQAMYIQGNKLIMISNKQRYYYAIDIRIADGILPPNKEEQDISFDVSIYNIADINNITPLSTTNLEGTYNNSRISNEKLYIVSQFSPKVTVEYPKIEVRDRDCKAQKRPIYAYEDGAYMPECESIYHDNGKTYRYDYKHPIIKDIQLIPTINKGEKDLISHDTFYAPHKLNQFPTITSISKFNLSANNFEKSISTAGYTNKLYASSKNIYLTSVQYPYYYDFRSSATQELIYKFSIGDDFDYKAKGFVSGTTLDQYAFSEKDDILRVATTSGEGWRGDTENSVFTLQENGKKLDILGSLKGLGKEGERIRGVRFLGDRGYVVTFKQTDPLYTIDMSDASHPSKVGELEINGFSSYIHPVDNNYILTLGRDADANGRQAGFIVQLFDVSDFAHPNQADIISYSASMGGFDAEYNPQAFIYRPSDKRFGITYKNQNLSVLDNFQINTTTGKFVRGSTLSAQSNAYENRGIIFNQNNRIYSTLFSANKIITQDIGAVQ